MSEQDPSCGLDKKIEILRFISETHRKAREERRGAHAKAFFTTLTFFAALAAARYLNDFKAVPTSLTFTIFVWVALALVGALAVTHLFGLEAASRVNRELAQRAENELMKIVQLQSPSGAGRWVAQIYLWEAAMIATMAIIAGLSLTIN